MNFIVNKNLNVYKQQKGYVLKDTVNNRFMKFNENEYKVFEKFNEIKTTDNLSDEEIIIFDALREANIILEEGQVIKEDKEKFSLLNFKIIEWNTEFILDKIKWINNIIFNKIFKLIFALLIIGSVISIFFISKKNINVFSKEFYTTNSILEMVIVYLLMLITTGIHELSHALTMLHYNLEMKAIGIKLYFLQLLIYCDLSNLYIIEDKRKKINTYLAGIVSQIFFTSLAICTYTLFLIGLNIRMDFIMIFAVLNFIGGILNVMPLVKFDGYWVLTTILGIYNLDSKALKQLKNVFKREEKVTKGLLLFGIASIIFKAYLVFGTIDIVHGLVHQH